MKKILVLLVLSLFLVSLIPAVFAESDTAKAKRALIAAAKTAKTSGEDSETGDAEAEETAETGGSKEAPGQAVSACMQRLLKAKPNLLRNQAQEICVKSSRLQKDRVLKAAKLQNLTEKPAFAKYNKNLAFKARAITKIKLEKARENFLKAKERFGKARERYQSAKEKFSESKEKTKECEESETEECQQIMEQIREHAKDNLLAIADRILEHLNKLKSKVEANEDLSEEEAAELLEKINSQITEVEAAKATIEASENKDEIIDAAKKLKTIWNSIKEHTRLNAARTVNARIGGIIVKSKQLEVKLNKILERMAEAGKDTSAVEPLISDFNAKLEEAKTSYEAAVEKLKEAKAATPPNKDLIQEGQALMKDAHNALQDAQKILRDILKAVKESDGEEELEEVEEEEEAAETEEGTEDAEDEDEEETEPEEEE